MRLRNTVTIRETTFRLYRCRCGTEHLTRHRVPCEAKVPARIAG